MNVERAYEILKLDKNISKEEFKTAYNNFKNEKYNSLCQNSHLINITENELKEMNKVYKIIEKYFNEKKMTLEKVNSMKLQKLFTIKNTSQIHHFGKNVKKLLII